MKILVCIAASAVLLALAGCGGGGTGKGEIVTPPPAPVKGTVITSSAVDDQYYSLSILATHEGKAVISGRDGEYFVGHNNDMVKFEAPENYAFGYISGISPELSLVSAQVYGSSSGMGGPAIYDTSTMRATVFPYEANMAAINDGGYSAAVFYGNWPEPSTVALLSPSGERTAIEIPGYKGIWPIGVSADRQVLVDAYDGGMGLTRGGNVDARQVLSPLQKARIKLGAPAVKGGGIGATDAQYIWSAGIAWRIESPIPGKTALIGLTDHDAFGSTGDLVASKGLIISTRDGKGMTYDALTNHQAATILGTEGDKGQLAWGSSGEGKSRLGVLYVKGNPVPMDVSRLLGPGLTILEVNGIDRKAGELICTVSNALGRTLDATRVPYDKLATL